MFLSAGTDSYGYQCYQLWTQTGHTYSAGWQTMVEYGEARTGLGKDGEWMSGAKKMSDFTDNFRSTFRAVGTAGQDVYDF